MKNTDNRFEFAGAFGDLGTLIPFLVAYIKIAEFNPVNIVFVFGVILSKLLKANIISA